MSNFRTTENSYRGRDIWREVHEGGGRGARVQWTKIENLFMMIYFKLSKMFLSPMSSKFRLSYQLQIIRHQQCNHAVEKICCQSKQKMHKVFCGQLQGHGWVWLMMGANRGRRQAMLPTHFVSSTNYCRRLGWVLSKHSVVLAMADTIIPPFQTSTQRLTCAFWLPGCMLCLETPT